MPGSISFGISTQYNRSHSTGILFPEIRFYLSRQIKVIPRALKWMQSGSSWMLLGFSSLFSVLLVIISGSSSLASRVSISFLFDLSSGMLCSDSSWLAWTAHLTICCTYYIAIYRLDLWSADSWGSTRTETTESPIIVDPIGTILSGLWAYNQDGGTDESYHD